MDDIRRHFPNGGEPLTMNQSFLGITKTGYYLRKTNWNNSTKNQVSSIFADPLCRLAEVYLNYAECSNEAYGPTAKGVPGSTLSALEVAPEMIRSWMVLLKISSNDCVF